MTATTAIPPPRPLAVDVLPIPEISDLAGVTDAAVHRWRFRTRTEIEKIDTELQDLPGMPVSEEDRQRREHLTERRAKLIEREFPEPDDYVGSIPVWRLERIVAWFDLTARKYDVRRWRAKRLNGGYRRPRT